ncbi:MAG: UDP-N-acetylmuramoyl-L-alanyl-D-glutamate--2,6-diaminopimelate ligase [Chitinophagales bacterium]|nr:UDP-N-acetylmuramoyl-L-alanyl-D-glutamate--2,6-diaminopimelate ligase [Chitinophagales bacterium]
MECDDVRGYMGELAHAFYGFASDSLRLIGVTGTNGKTTVATLLYQLLSGLGYKCGLISTVENRIIDRVLPAERTTPDVISLHKLLAEMKLEQCEYVFMEVSSHALDQKRVAGLKFDGAIFTNLTHDHLDYHGTMLNYIIAKKSFFDNLPSDAFALVNVDDKNGSVMLQNTKARKLTYAMHTMADYKAKIIENTVHGLHLRINDREAFFRMIGDFNAYNITAVYGTAVELGIEKDEILALLSGLRGAVGRFEQVISSDGAKFGIVDYAHTPDALKNVLQTIQKVKHTSSQVIVVIGCGGDRDKSKRPEMAKEACELSDKVVLTSDNPRSEDPDSILDDMEAGVDEAHRASTIRITDRRQAIKTAVMMAQQGDIILVAGKGHEDYQEIKGKKFPFDDKKILQEYLG